MNKNEQLSDERSAHGAAQPWNGSLSLPDVWRSKTLLGDAQTVAIEHAGQRYWLRRTKENKLILTK
ncbi:hemin uptake protein HemP [Thiomicrospira sp. WB1]|uniref:hemin uptake protein HemP n=1 Tax=Thiomicrospira sp. WB1 TaxID=1685380 RepID=UPI0007468EBA|nr:hemin uptake protein HemP [Thiomicrospira sp. WB1]KUJ71072.1 hypothetical protein AVO41_09380 [Thiomicrospira sp. WB1]